jgi:hypothetical protein
MHIEGEDLVNSGFVVVGVWAWFWSQRAISSKAPPPAEGGLGDRLFTWGTPVNRWYHAHPRAADATLIVTSMFIDVLAIYMFAATILGDTVRPFLSVLIVFAMRQICEYLVTLPEPEGMIWRNPGFPSLLVTYKTENDFFFSGHTAISVVAAAQLVHAAPVWLAIIGVTIAAIEATTVLVFRAHYTMDVFAAIVAGVTADWIATGLAPSIDDLLRGLV